MKKMMIVAALTLGALVPALAPARAFAVNYWTTSLVPTSVMTTNDGTGRVCIDGMQNVYSCSAGPNLVCFAPSTSDVPHVFALVQAAFLAGKHVAVHLLSGCDSGNAQNGAQVYVN